MTNTHELAVWFPAVHAGTGVDVFTQQLADGLAERGIRAQVTWLPLRAEYAPWTVAVPEPPVWATVVHVNSWLHGRFIPRSLPMVVTVHHCVHDPAFRPYKSTAQTAYHRVHIKPIERAVLKRANAIVAVSQFTAGRTQAAFGSMPVSVILNGVDVDGVFRPPSARLVHEPMRLIFAGSWLRRKGVDLLAPIMRRLGSNFTLAVIGEGPRDARGMPSNIEIVGRVGTTQDLAAAYCDADALLFPSRLEGFGLVAAEAMACGLPVIATRGSSLTEVVDDGVTGILCQPDDVDAFAAAAKKLVADRNLALAMSNAARKRAIDHFSASSMIEAYIRTYRQMMSS